MSELQLHDNDYVQKPGDLAFYSVKELRDAGYTEGELRVLADTPPQADPYAREIAERRAACATDLSRFEDRYKIERMREIEQTRATLDEHPTPRLTTAQLAEYAQPDPYAADVKKLQERDARALAAKESR